MLATKRQKLLSVRLPEEEVRRVKSLAAQKGISLQEAVHQAISAWDSPIAEASLESLDALQGSLADVDVDLLMREDRDLELAKDQRWS